MEILQYIPDMQTPVTQFYNRMTANVPHCYPVKEEEFAIAMHRITADEADIKDDGLDSEALFCLDLCSNGRRYSTGVYSRWYQSSWRT